MDLSLVEMDATQMASLVRSKQVTCLALLEAHFDRVDALNPSLNAIIWQDRDGARARAGILDEEVKQDAFRGPLHGVPITVKEAFDFAGSPSTWGNPALEQNYPKQNSDVVQRYLDAGANLFGKTNVPLNLADWQSFNAIYGTTNNPWDITRGPGGSSGGSAAALATGMSALEAGSDIGSSIRNPAHYCGVFGLKPTWGVVSEQGHSLPGWHTDIDIAVTGPMARSARDLTLAFELLAGSDRYSKDTWSLHCPKDERKNISDFKIALKLSDPACPVDQAYQERLADFAEKLATAGATVREIEPVLDTKDHFDTYLTLLGAAMGFGVSAATVAAERAEMESKTSGIIRDIMTTRLNGRDMRHSNWMVMDNKRRIARQLFDSFFQEWDILLTPVCASAAFRHNHNGQRYERELTINEAQQPEMQQLFWSGYSGVVGLPSTVGPMDFVGRLPVGYQAIAGYGKDRTALAFARCVENQVCKFTAPPV
ncbi:MAG: amidase family protein [Amylibacter sp.]